jgi:uncharacterized protein YhjY with autotransporter beta-barrel domain
LKKSDISSYQLNLYAGQYCPSYFNDVVLGVAFNQYDTTRNMPSIGASAKGSFNGQTYGARLRSGFIKKLGKNWDLIPEVNLTYAHNNINSYTETNAGTANLHVKTNNANFLEGAVGGSIGYTTRIKSAIVHPSLKLMYGYAFTGYNQTSNSNFVNQNFNIATQSGSVARNSFRADLGVNVFTLKEIIVSANYLFEKRNLGFTSHGGVLRVTYQF